MRLYDNDIRHYNGEEKQREDLPVKTKKKETERG